MRLFYFTGTGNSLVLRFARKTGFATPYLFAVATAGGAHGQGLEMLERSRRTERHGRYRHPGVTAADIGAQRRPVRRLHSEGPLE